MEDGKWVAVGSIIMVCIAVMTVIVAVNRKSDNIEKCNKLGYEQYDYNSDVRYNTFNERCFTLNKDGTIQKEKSVKFQ